MVREALDKWAQTNEFSTLVTVSNSYSFRNCNFLIGDCRTNAFEESWMLNTDPTTGDLICREDPAGSPLAYWTNSPREVFKQWADCEGREDLEMLGSVRSWALEGRRMKFLSGNLVCVLIAMRNATSFQLVNREHLAAPGTTFVRPARWRFARTSIVKEASGGSCFTGLRRWCSGARLGETLIGLTFSFKIIVQL
jgi:hypothetical protein